MEPHDGDSEATEVRASLVTELRKQLGDCNFIWNYHRHKKAKLPERHAETL